MAKHGTLLAVDDNPAILTALKICLGGCFNRIITLSQPEEIPTTLQQEEVSIVLLDMNFQVGINNGLEGLSWMETIHRLHPHTPVVLMTAYGDVPLAVRALKQGAADFVTKPWENEALIRTLRDAIARQQDVVSLEELEAMHIRRALDHCHGNVKRAAEMLGVTRQTIYKKMKQPPSTSPLQGERSNVQGIKPSPCGGEMEGGCAL